MSYLGSCNPIFRHRSPNPNQTAAGALVTPADTFHLGHTQYLGKSISKELHLHPGVFFPPKSMETLLKIPPAQPQLCASASRSSVLKQEAGSAAGAELPKERMLVPSLNFPVSQ